MAKVVQISAHCDHSADAGSITYDTYADMLASGAEYAELEIRRTADDVLVVHHDACTAATGPLLSGLTYRELCDLLGYPVPRADEVMTLLAGRAKGHLDLKEIGYEAKVAALASSILGDGNFVITTLEDISVTKIKRCFPGVRTALSLGRSLRDMPRHRWAAIRHSELFPLRRIRACGADWAAVNYRLARLGVTKACHRQGIGVMVWTVDPGPLIDRFLLDQRAEVLVTNRPGHAARRRAQLGLSTAHPLGGLGDQQASPQLGS